MKDKTRSDNMNNNAPIKSKHVAMFKLNKSNNFIDSKVIKQMMKAYILAGKNISLKSIFLLDFKIDIAINAKIKATIKSRILNEPK